MQLPASESSLSSHSYMAARCAEVADPQDRVNWSLRIHLWDYATPLLAWPYLLQIRTSSLLIIFGGDVIILLWTGNMSRRRITRQDFIQEHAKHCFSLLTRVPEPFPQEFSSSNFTSLHFKIGHTMLTIIFLWGYSVMLASSVGVFLHLPNTILRFL